MDLFRYTAAVAELRACNYKKDIELLVRKYSNLTNRLNAYGDPYEHYKLTYKLFALSLNLFAAKSKAILPDFIYYTHLSTQKQIIYYFSTNKEKGIFKPLLNYEELINFFEFDTIVETNQGPTDQLAVLHSTILDKPIHFKLIHNQSLSHFDNYSTNVNSNLQIYLHALRLKQTLSPSTPSTVLDKHLEETFSRLNKHMDISTQITLLQQHTSALQEYQLCQTTAISV